MPGGHDHLAGGAFVDAQSLELGASGVETQAAVELATPVNLTVPPCSKTGLLSQLGEPVSNAWFGLNDGWHQSG